MKIYKTPKITVITLDTCHILAGSLNVNEIETNQMLSKEHLFDTDFPED